MNAMGHHYRYAISGLPSEEGSIRFGPLITSPDDLYLPCQQENTYFVCVDREGVTPRHADVPWSFFTELGISVVSAKRVMEFAKNPANDCKSARDLVSGCSVETFSIRNKDHFYLLRRYSEKVMRQYQTGEGRRVNIERVVKKYKERGEKVPEELIARISSVRKPKEPKRNLNQYGIVKWANNDDCSALVRDTLADIKKRLNAKTPNSKFYFVQFDVGADDVCLSQIYRGFQDDFSFEGSVDVQSMCLFVQRRGVFSNPNYETKAEPLKLALERAVDIAGLRFEAVKFTDESEEGVEITFGPDDKIFGHVLHSGSNDTVQELSLLAFLLKVATSKACRREYTEKMRHVFLTRFSDLTGIGLINDRLRGMEESRPKPFADYPYALLLTMTNPDFSLEGLPLHSDDSINLTRMFSAFAPQTISVACRDLVWLTFDTEEDRDEALAIAKDVLVFTYLTKGGKLTNVTARPFDPDTTLTGPEKRQYAKTAKSQVVTINGISRRQRVESDVRHDMDAVIAHGKRPFISAPGVLPYLEEPESDSEDEVWHKRKSRQAEKEANERKLTSATTQAGEKCSMAQPISHAL